MRTHDLPGIRVRHQGKVHEPREGRQVSYVTYPYLVRFSDLEPLDQVIVPVKPSPGIRGTGRVTFPLDQHAVFPEQDVETVSPDNEIIFVQYLP